jgi:sodium/proline symporter
MIPGFAANLLAIYVVSLLTPKPGRETEEKFEQYKQSA